MNRLHRFAVRHPGAVISVAALVTIAMAPGMLRLRIRTDGHALIPQGSPVVRLDREVRRHFGVRDPVVVLIRPRDADGIFNPNTLHLVGNMTRTLTGLPGLDSTAVRSLATEIGDRFRPGTLEYRRLLEPVPATRAQLDELRGDLDAIGLYHGTLVSFDGRAAAIHVGMPPEADRAGMLALVRGVIAGSDTSGHDVHLIGAPVAEALLGSHILEDLGISMSPAASGTGRRFEGSEPGMGWLARLRLGIARHVGLLPLSIAVMALVFLFWFRSFTATLLPLVEAGASLVFVFGLMGWTGVPVYLTMAVLPVILVSMGLADEIHVFTCYRQHLDATPAAPAAEVVTAALDDMVLPVAATSLTTAVGFLSFAISPLEPVRAFGLFTAAGIVFCMLWTLTVIPAMLVLFSRGRAARSRASSIVPDTHGREAAHRRLARTGRPTLTLLIAVLGLALTPLGIRRLVVQDSWVSGFAPESEFYLATEYFNRQFYGTHRLLLALDTEHVELHGTISMGDIDYHEIRLPRNIVSDPRLLEGCSLVITRKPGPEANDAPAERMPPIMWESVVESAGIRDGRIAISTPPVHGSALMLLPASGGPFDYSIRSQRFALPDVLHRVEDLEAFARGQGRYTVGGVLGPTDQITTAEFLLEGRLPDSRTIPRNPDRVRWLWNSIARARGPERVREVVDSTFERALVTVFLKNANFVDTGHLMEAIREYERAHLAPDDIRLDFAGDVAVSQALIEAIVRSQVGSLLLSLLGILAVTAVLFRSVRWGIICMLPAGCSVAATFSVMGAIGMPLGVATSMFAAMVLGIGVDFGIHLVERFRASVARGMARDEAVLESLRTTGPPIVVNALAIALGFGMLVFSRVPANAQLGAITLLSLLTCVAATLLIIPALLRLGSRRESG